MKRREFLSVSALAVIASQRRAAKTGVSTRQNSTGIRKPLFGSMVSPEDIANDAAVRRLAIATCDSIVMAGGVFWASIEKERGVYDFTRSERVRDFARSNSMIVRGSVLVWHRELPPWLAQTINPANALELLDKHVRDIVAHFRGSVAYWDVLNEVVNPQDRRVDWLRVTPWLKNGGIDYMRRSFVAAREADPAASLGYNEFGLEDDSGSAREKRRAVLALLRRFRNEGVPIDYLGIQGHLNGRQHYSHSELGSFLRSVEDLGVAILVTELDVDDRAFSADRTTRDAGVADTYARFLDVVMKNSSPRMITTWGLSDRRSYPQATRPRDDGQLQRSLPFDADLRPKRAWTVLRSRGIALRDPDAR